jgi:hypothetical protein
MTEIHTLKSWRHSARTAGKTGSDLELFLVLEESKKQEIRRKELMIWAGRPVL